MIPLLIITVILIVLKLIQECITETSHDSSTDYPTEPEGHPTRSRMFYILQLHEDYVAMGYVCKYIEGTGLVCTRGESFMCFYNYDEFNKLHQESERFENTYRAISADSPLRSLNPTFERTSSVVTILQGGQTIKVSLHDVDKVEDVYRLIKQMERKLWPKQSTRDAGWARLAASKYKSEFNKTNIPCRR